MAVDDRMPIHLSRAKTHVYNVCQGGPLVKIIKSLSQDELGGELSETDIIIHSFPIRFKPFPNEIREKVSWSEKVDVIFYFAKQEMEALLYTLEQIKQFKKIELESKEYDIKYVDYFSAFADDFLYLIIGACL